MLSNKLRPFLFFVLFPAMAFAQQGPAGQAWPQLIDQLVQDKGIQKVGDFDLQKFSEDARKRISWKDMPADAPSVIAGARTSAYYLTATHEVFISRQLPADALSSLPDLEVHEGMGALGIEDQDYARSTALRVLLEEKSPTRLKNLREKFGKDLFSKKNMMIRSEGGSSVSGGGDLRMMLIKNRVLTEILKSEQNISMDFLASYPHINFEPVKSAKIDYVSIRYDYQSPDVVRSSGALARVPIKADGSQERFTFYVPMSLWDKGGPSRAALLSELRFKATGLFAADPGQAEAMSVPICQGQARMRFPRTEDRDVISIQKVRGGLMKGCDPMKDYSQSMFAPSIPEGQRPHEAGIAYYECVIRTEAGERREPIAVAAGLSMMRMISNHLDEERSVIGLVQFDKAAITGVGFAERDHQNFRIVARKSVSTIKDASIAAKAMGLSWRMTCGKK